MLEPSKILVINIYCPTKLDTDPVHKDRSQNSMDGKMLRTFGVVTVLASLFFIICKWEFPQWVVISGSIGISLIIIHLLKDLFDNGKAPPGPKGWPILGMLVEL
ncbi:unnamed protein product, partial [Allacma fusca]